MSVAGIAQVGEGHRRVYLDFAATSPLSIGAQEAMRAAEAEAFGNASSAHWAGETATRVLEAARLSVRRRAGFGDRIVFTSGATESNWLAILGLLAPVPTKRLITSAIEHDSVYAARDFARSLGTEVAEVGVDHLGRLRLEHLQEIVNRGPAVVVVMHANNEVGTLQPIGEIADIVHRAGGTLHVDAAQSFGKVPLDGLELADTVAVSAHKISGPKGVGAVLVRDLVSLAPPMAGGQEFGLRRGTQDVPGIAGFARAAAESDPHGVGVALGARAAKLRSGLTDAVPEIRWTGDLTHRAPHIVSCIIPGVAGDVLAASVDALGVAVSVGSACHAGAVRPSHVLMAMGASSTEAACAVRLSVGFATTDDDIAYAVWAVSEVARRLRGILRSAQEAGANTRRKQRPPRSAAPQGGLTES
jgi:cysteine desulfurase